MNIKLPLLFTLIAVLALSCTLKEKPVTPEPMELQKPKIVVYQVFTRLFGNTVTLNKPWGTAEENGVGKFNHFTEEALREIRSLGVTHIWYTGVPHHALIRDYTSFGISNDDPDVVKGRAGSPFAVKDYYNVNPDLAEDPSQRLQEFQALIERTHFHGMKVIMDIVPNHVARGYEGKTNPPGIVDFGAEDDTAVVYRRHNNFYYIPGENFLVPEWLDGYKPLGGEAHPLSDGYFREEPAKWTGNGSRLAQPHFYDWYETVKVNYGVTPDGTKDFEELPATFAQEDLNAHYNFWQGKDLPDSWKKFHDIVQYWLAMGVDGFRFDMAEMVPVEFWSYLNSSIKMTNPQALLLAEVYNPSLYRDYLHLGKMDYLYDKVELYDTLKHIIQGQGLTDNIPPILEGLADIEHHMLHFLENHDEQRVASPEFAGNADKGKPAMVLSATVSTSPTMIYFGQEVGEPGAEDAGFGKPSRTSIFDYIGVPYHQRWMNNRQFDGGQLSAGEIALREFYKSLLNFTINSDALRGAYQEIHRYNRLHTTGYNHRVFSFVRWSGSQKLLIICNFDAENTYEFTLEIPAEIIAKWDMSQTSYQLINRLNKTRQGSMTVSNGRGKIPVTLEPLESAIWEIR